MARLRPVSPEERLSVVDHLDELRKRLIVAVIAFSIAFGFCLWQNNRIIDALERPLQQAEDNSRSKKADPLEQTAALQQAQRAAWVALAAVTREIERDGEADPALTAKLVEATRTLEAAAEATPRSAPRRLVTIGVAEPFTVTIKTAAYAALLLTLPLLLYQTYAFIVPAFSREEKQVAVPLMLAVPFLFVAGAGFAYALVLPNALNFLVNFNDDNFDILLGAREYFRFAILLLMVMGVLFQIPVGILALTRSGIISAAQLRKNRRYAILVVAVMAMFLPGTDPVTMLIAMAPLLVLYEGSILFASLLDRRAERREREREAEDSSPAGDREGDTEQVEAATVGARPLMQEQDDPEFDGRPD